MEHEEIKIRGREANRRYAVVDERGNGQYFYEEIEDFSRAERFVKCWNEHDWPTKRVERLATEATGHRKEMDALKLKADCCDDLVATLDRLKKQCILVAEKTAREMPVLKALLLSMAVLAEQSLARANK